MKSVIRQVRYASSMSTYGVDSGDTSADNDEVELVGSTSFIFICVSAGELINEEFFVHGGE